MLSSFNSVFLPLTAAEKMRKYRQRLKEDPVKRQQYLTKERQRWKHRRETGKEKVISELSDRDKRRKRKMRREAQKRFCLRRQQQKAPVSDPVVSSTTVHPTIPVVQPCSTARSRGRSRVRRDRAKAYRKITALEAKLEETKRLYERYRKRCQRQKKVGPHNGENKDLANSTPKTKTKLMLRKKECQQM